MRLTLPFIVPSEKPVSSSHKKKGRGARFTIGKRQKFVIAVLILSGAQFIVAREFGQFGVFTAPVLGILTDLFLLWSIYPELRESFTPSVFILPFFFTFAFGLFSYIIPARLLFQSILLLLYALGLYSLYLSQNVFIVAAIRTIALLSGARIVSFVLTVITYFFLMDIIFSLHTRFLIELLLVTVCTFFLIYQSLWTYSLQKSNYSIVQWARTLTIIVVEAAIMVWFWPSTPTVLALFLTGILYVLVGLSHVWLEKRLFRGVLWEYLWVGVVVFFVLISFTAWGK